MDYQFLYEVRLSAWRAFWQAVSTSRITDQPRPVTKIAFGSRNTLFVIDPINSTRRRIGDKT